jgi:hypothetical protein
MATKYIVDNVSGQTITGDITINGNLSVTGSTTSGVATYKALLTQTAPISGFNLNTFNLSLIVGETYTINTYNNGDDFSNVADVQSGTINQAGCVFIATGCCPNDWSSNSELISSGNLVVDVIENSLGYDLEWSMFFIPGFYIAYPQNIGPKYNGFPRRKVSVATQQTLIGLALDLDYVKYYSQPTSFNSLDDIIIFQAWNSDTQLSVDDTLFYTPIEINIKQDLDTTPLTINGSVTVPYSFSYPSIQLNCNGNYVDVFVGDNITVNDLPELVNVLNSNIQTSFLGTYSEDGTDIYLTIPTNLKNRFCSSGTLTFEVYSD